MSNTKEKEIAVDEDEEFFTDHGRTPSTVRRAAYLAVGMCTVLLPVYLYVGVLGMNLGEAQITVIAGSLVGAAMLSLAYHNIYFANRVKLVMNYAAPTKSMFKRDSSAYGNAMNSYEANCSTAAVCYSFFYNNLIHLLIVFVVGIYALSSKIPEDANFVVSTIVASGFAYYNSRKAMQAISE
mmetsp:Transcript_7049/g.21494  ORF Transcript_7049/g.21494 Transcript_7049/m.21494 type:complete len:182 (+) Transcript_7049:100-645(+)